ncbi:hypothetical protein Syun_011520 [Stephania yunnanensis]|uniref:F-box domain-containing protein n=1 Tax=Stephania yunnanensis TaxID=152371 RepID=A0AAP0PI76_9MAGN
MMELSKRNLKRKAPELDPAIVDFSLDELNQDLLERVLSWLPTSSFYRLRSVCKRWSSVAASASFRLACSQIPTRDPWFFMVDSHLDQSIVFDTAERNWKNLNHPVLVKEDNPSFSSIPVASSGGLVCFRNNSGDLFVCNPVTSACKALPPLPASAQNQALNAIAMNSYSRDSYKIIVVFGEIPNLSVRVYDSSRGFWEDKFMLSRKSDESAGLDASGDETLYFLSKAGDVVATNMQRSPSKQYSSVVTAKDGEEIVYFLSLSGTVVACNLNKKCFLEYPRLLPVFLEYSVDIVECRGEMLVVVLSEFLESASLRVWKFSERERSWRQVGAMPPSMSHEFYGKKTDINCVGSGYQILICVNSSEFSTNVLCDVATNEWIELPKCFVDGKAKDFMSAFSFEPRIEACV